MGSAAEVTAPDGDIVRVRAERGRGRPGRVMEEEEANNRVVCLASSGATNDADGYHANYKRGVASLSQKTLELPQTWTCGEFVAFEFVAQQTRRNFWSAFWGHPPFIQHVAGGDHETLLNIAPSRARGGLVAKIFFQLKC